MDVAQRTAKVAPAERQNGGGTVERKRSAWERVKQQHEQRVHASQRRSIINLKLEAATDEDYILRHDGSCLNTFKLMCEVFRTHKFQSHNLEQLYERYFLKLNQSSISLLVGTLITLCIGLIALYYGTQKTGVVYGPVLGAITTILIIIEVLCARDSLHEVLVVICNCVIVTIMLGMVCLIILTVEPPSLSTGVWETMFFIYMCYTLLPVKMLVAGISGLLLIGTQVGCSVAVNWSYGVLNMNLQVSYFSTCY